MQEVFTIIQNIGFPIACCVFLGYFIKNQTTNYREDVKEITAKYEKAIAEFKVSLDSITAILNRLVSKFGIEEN